MPTLINNNDTIEPRGNLDPNRMVSEDFANVLVRAYLDASDEVRKVIDTMSRIIADPQTDPDDRESCLDTLTEALFPCNHSGMLGVDLEAVRMVPRDGTSAASIEERMAQEEQTFATRLADEMDRKNISQTDLAIALGIGQPAVSMMLNRECRPQRRTVERIAKVLHVDPAVLWPTAD